MNHIHRLSGQSRHAATLIATSLAAALATPAWAQSLETVTIEGQAVDVDSANKPFSLLPNSELIEREGGTVAEKMNQTPGVAQTGFSPGASRPIIRGQDSDRVKILRNSSVSVDASSVSPDHALPIDPLTLKQVEITRGPAALAYGGNAIGGVVNLIDERIARQASDSFLGEFTTELFGAADTKATGLKLMAPTTNGFTLRIDGFHRDQNDLSTPDFTDPNGNRADHIANSSLKSDGGGLGLSYVFDAGYIGVSAEHFSSNYGVPQTEPPELVRIGLEQDRFSLEGEYRLAGQGQKIRYRLSQTDYQHQEFEDGQAATQFTNEGTNGRLEWFSPLGQFGVQYEQFDFGAVGDEAFVPPSQTDTFGAYYLGNQPVGSSGSAFTVEYGLRFDSTTVSAQNTGSNSNSGQIMAGLGFTGSAFDRDFDAISASVGLNWEVSEQWALAASLSRSERAPSSFELLADGVHIATAAYEKGNLNLSTERSTHLELTNTWKLDQTEFSLSNFYTDFSNYIGLFQRSGANSTVLVDGENVPVFDFVQVPAEFYGLEFEASHRTNWGQWAVTPKFTADWVRAKRTDSNENIPRQTPLRADLSVALDYAGWTITPQVHHVAASKPGAGETRTDSYNLVNLGVSKSFTAGDLGGQAYLRLTNLTDELAFNANTIETVRFFTPLAGRSINVGLKVLF